MKGSTPPQGGYQHHISRNTGQRLAACLALVALAGLMTGACREPAGTTIRPADLYGTWEGETFGGGAYLVFRADENINRFEFRAAPGEFGDVLDPGDNLLSMGYFGLSGTIINLVDEEAAVYACPGAITDRYDVILNTAGTIMRLDHVGEECPVRAQLLTGATWMRQSEE
ncbi:MAG: hypothetical protein V3W14_13035 [Candidatus Neomarinimicrobiota bacterium]